MLLILKTDFSVFIDFMMLEEFQIPFKVLLSEFSLFCRLVLLSLKILSLMLNLV